MLSHQLKLECFGEPEDANAVIAFSFGASECVNKVLAAALMTLFIINPKLTFLRSKKFHRIWVILGILQ